MQPERHGDLPERLYSLADGDLREYARDSLIGVHPDQNELREWAVLMDEAADEIARLRRGIQDMLDGNYPHPRAHRPGRCPHGVWFYEECPACTDEALQAILTPPPAEPEPSEPGSASSVS